MEARRSRAVAFAHRRLVSAILPASTFSADTEDQCSYPVASVDEELRPSLHLRFRLEDAFTAGDVSARATVRNRRGRLITSQLFYTTSIDNEAVAVSDDVELWHVVGRGEQPLYDVTLDLIANNGQVLDTRSCRVGFRRIVLRQEPVDKGSSFCFEINGEAIFAGGSNWIPIDTTLASASPERYREWLQCAVYGGHNMIRVWGGESRMSPGGARAELFGQVASTSRTTSTRSATSLVFLSGR